MKPIYWLVTIYVVIGLAEICHADQATEAETIRQVALEENFDPALAVAIATVESGLNPRVVGTQGEVGVFQLLPSYHPVANALDTRKNAHVAIQYLKKIRTRYEPVCGDAWIIFYNLGPNYQKRIRYPALFGYYKRVAAVKERIIAWNPQ
jgi:soluble lytic murein transglycosylase-like protein